MVFYAFALFLILIALLPLTQGTHWVIRGWDFIRVQTSFLQLLVIILIAVFAFPEATWEYIVAACLIATLLFQVYKVFPYSHYYPIRDKKPENPEKLQQISLLTSNVLQTNTDYDKLIKQVEEHQPDLLLVMETDKNWETGLKSLEKNYPHIVPVPLDNFYGMHLYSKYELGDTQVNYLVEKDIPSIFTKVYYNHESFINLICVHPAPPSPTENETSEERDAELLIIGKAVRELESPVIVCGDLNDVVWSRVSRLFAKMTGLIDPRIGRGLFPTFHADHWYLRFPIDHLFHSEDVVVDKMKRLPHVGSDHYPMFFTFWLETEEIIEKPELDEETNEEIEERINEGLESAE
ncbi:MAG: endonuclease/exonuclease/phosphatase family protein [Leeuwenhoekiella sp.]|nr:endonuclease/exonuclease/phosphatase family protein [Leeuwenhoekiella sp.]